MWYAEEVKSDDARVDRASGRLTGPVLLLNSHSVLSSKSRLRQHGALFALSHQPGRVWRGWMGALWVLAAGPQRFMKDTTLCGSNRRVHCLARDIVGRTCFDHGHKNTHQTYLSSRKAGTLVRAQSAASATIARYVRDSLPFGGTSASARGQSCTFSRLLAMIAMSEVRLRVAFAHL